MTISTFGIYFASPCFPLGPPAPRHLLPADLFDFPRTGRLISQDRVLDLVGQEAAGKETIRLAGPGFLALHLDAGGQVLQIDACGCLVDLLASLSPGVDESLLDIGITYAQRRHPFFQIPDLLRTDKLTAHRSFPPPPRQGRDRTLSGRPISVNVKHIVGSEQQIHDRCGENERPLPAEGGRTEKPMAAVAALDKPPAGYQTLAVGAVVEPPALLHLAITDVLLQGGLDVEICPAIGTFDIHGLKIIPHHFFSA